MNLSRARDKRLRRLFFATITSLAAILAVASPASASTVTPRDPSPYCRPYVPVPTVSLKYVGSNQYTATLAVTVSMNCNGAIYKGWAQGILEWSRDFGGQTITTGSKCSSDGKAGCSANVHYAFTASCADWIFIEADARMLGSWQQTSTSAVNSINTGPGASLNDSWNGDTVCP